MPRQPADLFFEKIASTIPGMVAVYNIQTGKYLYVNNTITKLIGLMPDDFYNGGVAFATSLVHPDDLPRITKSNMKALRRANRGVDEIVQFEYRMRHADGSWRWLHTDGSVFSRDKDGKVESVLNISIDITARRNTEEKLRRQFETEPSMLEAIVHSSEDAIVSKTLDGIIRTWNAGAEKILGYTAHEAIGKHITLIVPPDRYEEENLIIRRIRRGESIEHFDTKRLRKDGTIIDVSITISPIKSPTGRIIGASNITRDISDRKRHEELLREEEKRKDEFLAVLAHELRNPLAPISSAIEILQIKDAATEEGQWAVNIVHRQLTHMTRLIDDLLDVSRIARNRLELRMENIDLTEVVRAAMETSAPLIYEAQHTLYTSIPAKPLLVHGDFIRLAQIISNLLTNAAKYTPKGGSIWLSAAEKNGDVVITVRDSGIGISPDMQSRIFDMFIQGDRANHGTRGLGIGLTLVKRLTEMHSGSIEVESEGHELGSTFTLKIPKTKPDRKRIDPAPSKDKVTLSPLRILVVDDNDDALSTLEMSLRLHGNTTEIAHDGLEAVKAAQDFSPDVVLLDIGMPNMNGYEAAKVIRSQPWGQVMKLIAITGWGQESDKQRAKESGFDHHLTKPVDVPALFELLAAVKPTSA